MKLELEILELRTRHPFNIARAAAPPARRSGWIRLRDGAGNEGWGEAPATAYYGETADTVAALLPVLEVALADAAVPDLFALERIEGALDRAIGRNPAVKVAISAALHDLFGKRLGLPVWKLWGLDPAAAPTSSFTLGIDEPDAMRAKIREAAAYPILKVKVGTLRDEEVLSLIRDEAPAARIWVDANTAWTAKEALAKIPILEEYGVELIEQPFAPTDLEAFRLLRGRTSIPIVADESCLVSTDIPGLVGAVDGINIKLAKCGSLREAIRMVHLARAHHLQVMLGCMIESTLGIAAAIQLAPLVDYVDLDGAALLANDPFHGPGLESDGRLRFNTAPGLGVERRAHDE
jgi:L-alanine-DL-glutamate epimerase-like enolase superfamily enzyme